MNKRKKLFLLGLAFFVIMCISGIYSLSNEVINSTESLLSTSAVEIELKEYNENGETFDKNGKIVMPGDEIPLIPRVNNLGIDCYIRVKLSYTLNNQAYNVEDYIEGDYKNWTKKGDYYYYDSVLGKQENVNLFQKVLIPDNLSNNFQGKSVIINIVVEAIQAKNFDGDWEGVEIKKSVDRTYDINNTGESTVIYENSTDNYITISENFFNNLGNLIPGDTISEEVKVLNTSNKVSKFFVQLETGELSEEEQKLLENIEFVIKNSDGTIIHNTNLFNKDKLELGIFGKDEGDTFSFEVHLPKKLDNAFSKILTKLTWKFSLDVLGEEKENPSTGDLKFDLSITVFLLSSIGLIVVIILDRREAENIEN